MGPCAGKRQNYSMEASNCRKLRMCMHSLSAASRFLAWATFHTEIVTTSLLYSVSCVSPDLYNIHISNASTDQNKRANIPSIRITSLVEPLIQECWVRDPEQRPVFTHVAATLKRLRNNQGVEESPIPVQVELLSKAWSEPPHHSPSMHPLELPGTSPSTLQEGQDLDASVGDEFGTASEGTGKLVPGDTVSCGSQPTPFHPIGQQPCSNPLHHRELTVDPHPGNMEMPKGNYPGIAIYTPSRQLSLAESDSTSSASSHLTSGSEVERGALEEVRHHHHSHRVALGYEPSLPMDEQLAERRNELRFRSLARSSHGFHHSRMSFSPVL